MLYTKFVIFSLACLMPSAIWPAFDFDDLSRFTVFVNYLHIRTPSRIMALNRLSFKDGFSRLCLSSSYIALLLHTGLMVGSALLSIGIGRPRRSRVRWCRIVA